MQRAHLHTVSVAALLILAGCPPISGDDTGSESGSGTESTSTTGNEATDTNPTDTSPTVATTVDTRPIKSEMRALDADLASAIAKTSDRMSRAHLEDARDQIRKMLDPKD